MRLLKFGSDWICHWPPDAGIQLLAHHLQASCYSRVTRRRVRVSSAHRSVEEPIASSGVRSEEHTSELQSLMRISYAVFCLTNKNNNHTAFLSHLHRATHNIPKHSS